MDDFQGQIVEAAANFVTDSGDRSVGELDYSEGSLAAVEDMLSEAAGFIDEMTSDQITTLTQTFGCYILEVARREFGGRYYWFDRRDQPVLVVGEPEFRVALLAWDRVRTRLSGDEDDNVPFFYAGFAGRVRRAEPGTDALYV